MAHGLRGCVAVSRPGTRGLAALTWLLAVPPAPRVCYERTTWNPTVQTFVLSAVWHGVYPGYYLTFLTAVLVTLAARAVSAGFPPPRPQHTHTGVSAHFPSLSPQQEGERSLSPIPVCSVAQMFHCKPAWSFSRGTEHKPLISPRCSR